MKQVTLKSISIVNFRGHSELNVDFTGQTIVSGDNATGKSTIFDAFLWLLFGKDQFDRDNHEITPIRDGKRLDKVDSEVTAVIDIDHSVITLKRIYHQNWVRPKGQSEEVFKGNETLFYWNNVPKKAGEYKALVDAAFNETIFRLITNPSQFLSLHWQKQREFLFNIAGTVSDADILEKMATIDNKDAIANITNILNSGKALVDFKKELSARKKKLKDDLEDIQPRIDQTNRLMPEAKDFAAIENEIKDIEQQIAAIDLQIADRSKAIRSKYQSIQDKQGQINDLKTKQGQLINTLKNEAIQEANEANQELTLKKGEQSNAKIKLDNAKRNVDSQKRTISDYDTKIATLTEKANKLRNDWKLENEKQYMGKEGCLVCPLFGHECSDKTAVSKQDEAKLKAVQAFNENKQERLTSINREGKGYIDQINDLNVQKAKAEEELAPMELLVNELQREYDNLTTYLTENKPVEPLTITPETNEEWKKIQSQIEAIEVEIANEETENVDNSDLTSRKQELNDRRDELKQQFSNKSRIEELKQEVIDLEQKGKDIAQQIADLEKQEFAIADFTKIKIDECERRVNSMFEIVKFQLFDKTNDGNEFEACIPLNKKNVPISSTNTAERINAGLDIIRTLSSFYNVQAPIFCDGAESVNNFVKAGSQMVFLRVTRDKSLTIINN
jgi:chromosome segregation ATPase